MSTFTPSGSAGGAFACTSGSYAVGRSAITTAAPTAVVSFKFDVTRRALVMRVGTTAGAQDIVEDRIVAPGAHLVSFTPGVSPYYIEFQLRDVGNATLANLVRVAPGDQQIATPWGESDLPRLRSEQSLNVQWWAHPAYQMRVLERPAADSWSLRLFQPIDGPFEPNESGEISLTPSARTGTSVITASGPAFALVDAGSLIQLTQAGQFQTADANAVDEATDWIEVTGVDVSRTFQYEIGGTFVGSIVLEKSVGSTLSPTIVSTFSGVTSAPLADGLNNQTVYYRLRMSAYTSGTATLQLTYAGGLTKGVGRIFSVDMDNQVTVDVLAPFASLSATSTWARGSWSGRLGWPATVALFDGRLSVTRTNRRYQSAPDDTESFLAGANDDNAIAGTVPGPMNAPRWLKAIGRLLLGTGGGVGDISSGAFDEVMVPGNARSKVSRQRGTADADAVVCEDEAVFIHRSGRKAYITQSAQAKIGLIELSRLHRTIAGGRTGKFTKLAYQAEPEPRLWAVRDDGQIANMLLNIEEHIGAWSRLVPAGSNAAIESVCVTPGTPEDSVVLAVRRTIGGSTVRYTEKLAAERWTSVSEAWRLQSAQLYSGVAATHLTGLGHLEGEAVYVWGNGRKSGPYTVTGGAITVDYAVTYAIVGLLYQGFYKGPRINQNGQLGSALTQNKKIDRLGMLLHNCAGGAISWGGSFEGKMDTIPDRTPDGSYDAPLVLFTGPKDYPLAGQTQPDARVHLRFNGGGPATILGLVPSVNINER